MEMVLAVENALNVVIEDTLHANAQILERKVVIIHLQGQDLDLNQISQMIADIKNEEARGTIK